MPKRRMAMPVRMPSSRLDRRYVPVTVVIIVVHMFVLVFQRLMRVFVQMPLTQVQPDSAGHQ